MSSLHPGDSVVNPSLNSTAWIRGTSSIMINQLLILLTPFIDSLNFVPSLYNICMYVCMFVLVYVDLQFCLREDYMCTRVCIPALIHG